MHISTVATFFFPGADFKEETYRIPMQNTLKNNMVPKYCFQNPNPKKCLNNCVFFLRMFGIRSAGGFHLKH
jgi:hypothetical protein